MTTDNQDRLHPDFRSLLTWIVSGVLVYLLVSGAFVYWLPFSVYTQYSVIVHASAGVLAFLPTCLVVYLHWRRRANDVADWTASLARLSVLLLALSLVSGMLIVLQATFGTAVQDVWLFSHQLAALAFGVALFLHLLPILQRYRTTPSTQRRLARRWFLVAATVIATVPMVATSWLSGDEQATSHFQAFSDSYEWRYGKDRPFWPSRARITEAPWQAELQKELQAFMAPEEQSRLLGVLVEFDDADGGPLTRLENSAVRMGFRETRMDKLRDALVRAEESIRKEGALREETMLGSATCGSSGCHDQIYNEWLPSAHGFSAIDILFQDVQEALADASGVAETRSCAGCHDPVALLSGARDGSPIHGDDLVVHEGNSCLVCHSIIETDTLGNGGYVLQVPERYLFSGNFGFKNSLNKFLIRSYPDHHVKSFGRPLYEQSEFCAACHKQVNSAGMDTSVGIAQDQNEFDSWRQGHWYHEDDPAKTISCSECHMPYVESNDPGGDRHRSHRTLGSNMYIPVVQGIPGGEEQAARTVAWLRGEIGIPEIAEKWVDGPVVAMTIVAPDRIAPGELINLALVLQNNKTGHDFPAGPLDILASWIEVKVEDNLGRTLLHLGNPEGDQPTLDAPVVYKADWYDRRGLPVERHDIWEAVGASYKRSLESGSADVVDVPFRCPVVARPRISDSFSEKGPGERKSDVVFSIDNAAVTELTVTARVLYRKANPEFLARVYGVETPVQAPIIELNRAVHLIEVTGGD